MNTIFLLLAEYETGEIPLEDVADKYFSLSYKKACEKALRQDLPVPVYRCGSQKGRWMVSVQDLARYLDTQKEAARKDWKRINAA